MPSFLPSFHILKFHLQTVGGMKHVKLGMSRHKCRVFLKRGRHGVMRLHGNDHVRGKHLPVGLMMVWQKDIFMLKPCRHRFIHARRLCLKDWINRGFHSYPILTCNIVQRSVILVDFSIYPCLRCKTAIQRHLARCELVLEMVTRSMS